MSAPAAAEPALALPAADAPCRGAAFWGEEHVDRLFRFARRLSTSRDEARDLVQETLVRALRAGARVPDTADQQRAWLYRTAINVCRDRHRRAVVRRRHAAQAAAPADTGHLESQYVARIAVQQALARLDARRRAIVVLHEIDGEPAAEIARILQISAITVRWHLMRARRELARALG